MRRNGRRAGWYDDPFHRFAQRYHDGEDWTEHVSDGSGVSFVDPSGAESFITGPLASGPEWSGDGSDVSTAPPETGSPWRRLLARLVDGVVVGVPLTPVIWAIWGPDFIEISEETITYDPGALALLTGVTAVYEIAMIAWRGQTVGKKVCGLTVVGAVSWTLPGLAAAIMRWLVIGLYSVLGVFGSILLLVSIVMMFASPRRQMLHDIVARTVVVHGDAAQPRQEAR